MSLAPGQLVSFDPTNETRKLFKMKWQPIIEDRSTVERIQKILAHIDLSLQADGGSTYDLMYGTIGVSIYHSYRAKQMRNDAVGNRAIEIIEDTFAHIDQVGGLDGSFGRGLPGVLWAICHLTKHGLIDGQIEDCVDRDLLVELNERSMRFIKEGNYDYLLGGLGLVPLLLEMRSEVGQRSIMALLQEMAATAIIEQDDSLYWYQSPILGDGVRPTINLGLAHGIASIVVLFAQCYCNCKEDKHIFGTIDRSLRWLKGKELDQVKHGFFFPFSFGADVETFPPSLRWCYGGLGISIGIFVCGRLICSKEVESYGLKIALHCAMNRAHHSIVDAHLCHGSAGIAHIFARFFNYTGDEIFREASQYWFIQTCQHFDPTLSSGFRAWKGERFGWIEYPGLLEGSAGIGLALISSITDIEPTWDRCLLLS